MTATGTITNAFYGAVSDEVTIPAKGEAVHTFIQEPGVEISSGQSGILFDPCSLGAPLTYTHQITNTGNYSDSFDLSVNSSLEWVSTAINKFTLASGKSAFFTVEINPPCPTPPGTVDTATIAISSQADPSVSEIITDTTLVGYRRFLPAIFINQ